MSEQPPLPQQIPLPIQLRTSSVFASYYTGENKEVCSVLQNLRSLASTPLVFIQGVSGVGKTHLLQAACVRTSSQGDHAGYFPLQQLQEYGPVILHGTEQMNLVCLDDVGSVLHQKEWCNALFNLYRHFEESGGKLVLADQLSPSTLTVSLPDLASRILGGTVMRLHPLQENSQFEALQLQARSRGLVLSEEVLTYMMRRLPRDMHTLCSFLDRLDLASLASQRKLTVPFVKSMLLQAGYDS